jgi:hypothetical protein
MRTDTPQPRLFEHGLRVRAAPAGRAAQQALTIIQGLIVQ